MAANVTAIVVVPTAFADNGNHYGQGKMEIMESTMAGVVALPVHLGMYWMQWIREMVMIYRI